MRYFRNSELIKLYGVSDKSVRNWIEAAKDGKNSLELYVHDGKSFIADTLSNGPQLEELVQRGRKYRNERSYRKVTPTSRFYELYTPGQIIDIVNEIDIHREYPLSYRYFGDGATYWDAYLNKLYGAGSNNLLTTTIELLQANEGWLDALLKDYAHINVVDIGVGNGLATRNILEHIHKSGKLRRYIGIDLSQDLLDITERNMNKWFDNSIHMEKYVRDIGYERFTDILATDSFKEDAASTVNVLLFLGGAIMNFREPEQAVRTIRDSMGKEDILLSTLKLDSDNARRFFDFNVKPDKSMLPEHHGFMLEILSIDASLYDVEQFFDEEEKARFVQVRLKVNVEIDFVVGAFQKKIELQKGEALLLVRVHHFSDLEFMSLYSTNGLYLLQALKSSNEEYLMLASKVRVVSLFVKRPAGLLS